MKTAIVYVRVSSADQISGTSLSTQERDCKTWCDRNGYRVEKVFRDEGESAKTTARPGLLASMEYAKKEHIDCWVCWKLDRAARDQRDGLGIRATLRAHGCQLASATEPIADDPLGNLMAGMLFGISQFDNEIRSTRAKRAMQDVAMRGGWTNPLPTGYLWASRRRGDLPSLEPDPRLGPIIAAAYAALADGTPPALAIRMLVNAGMSAQTASKTLRAPIYAGIIRGKQTGGKDVTAAFPGIVTPDVYEHAQKALKAFTSRASTGHRPDFPLAAVAVCASCGRHVRGYVATGRHGQKIGYYDCPKGHVRMPAKKAHEQLTDIISKMYLPTIADLRQRISARIHSETEMHRAERADAQARKAQAETRLDRLTDLYADGAIDAETYRKKSAAYRDEIEACSAKERRSDTILLRLATCLDRVAAKLSNPSEFWKTIDFAGRKHLISAFGEKLAVTHEKTLRTLPKCADLQGVKVGEDSKNCDGAPTQDDIETATGIIRAVFGPDAS
jgi:site-specific DNA recombinase